ncbi:uncharacterized protein LOC105155524 [Sesamum indicum]|uniref:Uncharacterized protein LOC105155524 n=1 Tax=Sesamum indicum TaxID=4182 RepID=A0A6I9SJI9_SESIN|nr:uncharacterized protein LOC105155524 [Sesamum indicum]
MNTSKGTERINDEGAVEINVETVDYRKPAGRDKDAVEEKAEVTHLIRSDYKPGTGNVVAEAAGKVAEKLKSAEEAVSQSIGLKSDKKTE